MHNLEFVPLNGLAEGELNVDVCVRDVTLTAYVVSNVYEEWLVDFVGCESERRNVGWQP